MQTTARRNRSARAGRQGPAVALLGLLLLAPLPAVGPPRTDTVAAGTPAEPAPTRLDLTGKWLLRHVVRRSDRRSYRGLVLMFRVDLVQQGDRITGTATKWRENGRPVRPQAASTLRIDGRLEGDEIVGRFVETANGRRSRGTFRWRYSLAEGWLSGTFATSVASASGEATAVAIG
jgi:hypothetical protein